ncbi:MAG: Hsp20/alpha crystallin family protein [Chloroflexi bacterium]|nr:Hsp20/alpha crystallin family protein [Chloroflexota bacterium]
MRYRRLHHRYSVFMAAGEPRMLSSGWRFGPVESVIAQTRWQPPTDVYETAAALYITVELAGVEPDDLDVMLYEDALAIEGQRRIACEDRGVYHAVQIRQGQFRVEVPLPLPRPVEPEQIEARYENGLLRITVSKQAGEPRDDG